MFRLNLPGKYGIIPEIRLEADYAIIPLCGKHGQGKVARVSREDVKRVRAHKWYCTADGYPVMFVRPKNSFPKQLKLCHFVLGIPRGVWVDHKNHDRLDNRRENIRICTPQENLANRRTAKPRVYDLERGVVPSFNGSKFMAEISFHGKIWHLGVFESEAEARKVYDSVAIHCFGEFATVKNESVIPMSIEEARAKYVLTPEKQASKFRNVKAQSSGNWQLESRSRRSGHSRRTSKLCLH